MGRILDHEDVVAALRRKMRQEKRRKASSQKRRTEHEPLGISAARLPTGVGLAHSILNGEARPASAPSAIASTFAIVSPAIISFTVEVVALTVQAAFVPTPIIIEKAADPRLRRGHSCAPCQGRGCQYSKCEMFHRYPPTGPLTLSSQARFPPCGVPVSMRMSDGTF